MASSRRSKRSAPAESVDRAAEPDSNSAPRPSAVLRKPASKAKSKPRKRARVDVEAHETVQASGLDAKYRQVYYVPDLIDAAQAQQWHDELAQLPTWYQPTLKVYGRAVTQSRHIAAYATDPALEVNYSGTRVAMNYGDWPPVLQQIKDLVEQRLSTTFNHCMLNRYEDGKIYIGKHRDNRENLVIASVSLGAPRTFVMSYDKPPAKPPRADDGSELLLSKRWTLDNGSLVVMQGDTQKHWKHEIPKEPKIKESRISLTFRILATA